MLNQGGGQDNNFGRRPYERSKSKATVSHEKPRACGALRTTARKGREGIGEMDNGARIGDVVEVNFGCSQTVTGEVIRMPSGPGDSWVIYGTDGRIYHVQQFETLHVCSRRWDHQGVTP